MFTLYHHHDLARLADVLGLIRRSRSTPSPLTPDTVLVPNMGLGRWLKMTLAGQYGIAANIETVLPAPFFWQVLATGFGDQRPDSAAYRRENLRWHLYALLPGLAEDIPEVAHYLAEQPAELRRWQLAERLASLFDEYLIYRRDLLLRWERGEYGNTALEHWQAAVWRGVVNALGTGHRARLLGDFVERIGRGQTPETGNWPAHLFCFGLGNLPPDYLRLLYAMARHIHVHFFLPNPSDGYWGDIERRHVMLDLLPAAADAPGEAVVTQGHPLLASLGFGARDFLRLIYSDEFADIRELELGGLLDYQPPGDDTLLHRVQSGVIAMDATPATSADIDASFQVHACHGPLREVQVLHDQLLDLLTNDPTLEPRDIIVMTPDVAAFAPAIRAVFGAADGADGIPFNLSDQSRRDSHPMVLTFRTLLELPLWRWTSTDLITLINVPAVLRRFRLDAADADNLRRWFDEAGVRWGVDADHRESTGAGHWSQNSWQFGLDRLFAGVLLADADALVDGVAPMVNLEGGATQALGRFWLLFERLRAWREILPGPATAAAWRERLTSLCTDFLEADTNDRDELSALQTLGDALDVFDTGAAALGNEPLSWDAVRAIVDGELGGSASRQPFLAGGVTFCSLVPLRTVPFRVVCVLGMNDGVFPRRETGRSLNLVRLHPRVGDASPRNDDRLLLLQWLLAARDVFYLSYTGQDTTSGEALNPSIAVTELLDFVAANQLPGMPHASALSRLVTMQPMQPFSARYFAPGNTTAPTSRVFTFRAGWRAGMRAAYTERGVLAAFVDTIRTAATAPSRITLDELKRFFRHPSRYYLRDVEQLALEVRQDSVRDDETLALARLERSNLRVALWNAARAGNTLPETPPPWLLASGELPPPPLADAPYREALDIARVLLDVHGVMAVPTDSTTDVDIALGAGVRLVGRVTGIGPRGLVALECGELSGSVLLPHWIDLLAVAAAANTRTSLTCVGVDDKRGLAARAGAIGPALARQELETLVELYLAGQRSPLCFLPRLGMRYVEKLKPGDVSSAVKALASCNNALDGFNGSWTDLQDPWFAPLLAPEPHYLGIDPDTSEFCRLATAILAPLVASLQPVPVATWLAELRARGGETA
ncbi:MAG: exodeoxyribonuclease V subunit gamma [Pseudomonadales bacterium]|nr:exodeoxyribonuclease V subunit gamma [Pseudomonadales bacterium]